MRRDSFLSHPGSCPAKGVHLYLRFRQRSRHGSCSIALGMGYKGRGERDWLDGMRWVRLGSCFGTE
jgi:hypothetical protein